MILKPFQDVLSKGAKVAEISMLAAWLSKKERGAQYVGGPLNSSDDPEET